MIKLPFITRKKHEAAITAMEYRLGRTIAYVPVDKETRKRLKRMQVVGEQYAYHDSRIGWAERQEFDTYHDYIQFQKDDISYQTYLKRKRAKEKKAADPMDSTSAVANTTAKSEQAQATERNQ